MLPLLVFFVFIAAVVAAAIRLSAVKISFNRISLISMGSRRSSHLIHFSEVSRIILLDGTVVSRTGKSYSPSGAYKYLLRKLGLEVSYLLSLDLLSFDSSVSSFSSELGPSSSVSGFEADLLSGSLLSSESSAVLCSLESLSSLVAAVSSESSGEEAGALVVESDLFFLNGVE